MAKWNLLEADCQGAEARVVALLARDYTTLQLFDSVDVHKITAGIALEKAPPWLKIVDDISPTRYEELAKYLKPITKGERFIGKKTRHGGNYNMGKRRHMIEVNNDIKKFEINIDPISEWRAGKNLENFHAFTPKIRDVFHKEVEEFVSRNRFLVNPFGRKRFFFERMDHSLFGEAYAQIPQSTIADHLRAAGLRIKKLIPNIKILVEAHDALLFKLLEDEVKDIAVVIKQEFERPIDFTKCSLSRGTIIIPCEFQWSERNYRDLKEWHFEG